MAIYKNTMKLYLSIFTLAFAGAANSTPFDWNDKWHGSDKNIHFIGGLVASSIVTAYTQNSMTGTLVGCGLGLIKEVSDMSNRGTPSAQDAIITCAGAYIGSKLVEGLYLTPNKIGYTIRF